MNRWVLRSLILCSTVLMPWQVQAQEQSDSDSVEDARAALSQQEDDEDSARQLEEVFQSAEKNYSLLPAGQQSLTYSFDYTYVGDQRLDLQLVNNSIRNLDVTPSATHHFTNAFTYDFGVLDNLTVGMRLPRRS